MIKGGIDNVIEWLVDNNIQVWTITTNQNLQGNSRVFESDFGQKPEVEFERMKKVLAKMENPILYIHGRTSKDKNVNNFMETWRNMPEEAHSISGIAGAVPAVPAGYLSPEEVDRRIEVRVNELQLKHREEDLERREKELREDKKAFDEEQRGLFGILTKAAAPVIGKIMGIESTSDAFRRVAGTDSAEANRIEVKAPAADGEAQAVEPEPEQEDEIFTEEESNKLFELVAKWKEADPQHYMVLLERFVNLANGEDIVLFNGGYKLTYKELKTHLNLC